MALSNEEIAQKIDEFGFYDITQLFTVQDTYILYEPEVMKSLQGGFKLHSMEIPTFRDKIISADYENYLAPFMTNVNTVTFDADGKFGQAGKFNGTNQSLSVAHRANMKFGTENFTVEAFVKLNSYGTSGGAYAILTVGANNGGAYGNFWFGLCNNLSTVGSGYRLTAGFTTASATWTTASYYSEEIDEINFPLNEWHHVAVVRYGTDIYLYLNGQRIKSYTGIDSNINHNSSLGDIRIGAANANAGAITQWFSGSIDELRVSKGVGLAGSRYIGNTYDVPTSPHLPDASTSMLLHFRGNFNDNYLDEFRYFIQLGDDVYYYSGSLPILISSDVNTLSNDTFSLYGNDLNEIPFNAMNTKFTIIVAALTAQNILIKLPPYKLIQQLYEPELYVLSEIESVDCDMQTTNIFWQISPDGTNFYCYNFIYGNWYIPKYDYTGLTFDEVTALNYKDLLKLIPKEGKLYLKAVLNSFNNTKSPSIDSVLYTLGTYYDIGNCYMYTLENQIKIPSWEKITGVEVTEYKPIGSEIYYAVSLDNRTTWKYWKNNKWNVVSLTNLFKEGMTKSAFESSNLQALNEDDATMLDVVFCLVSTNYDESPSVTTIKFTHVDTDAIMPSNFVRVPVPDDGFRNVLVDDEYELKLIDGLAFNEPPKRYDLYTTPRGVKIRPLDAGTLVGGVESDIYPFEVINGYQDVDCNITLTIRFADQEATQFGLGCRLPDTAIDRYKTYVEMSKVQSPWNPQYPLKFKLNRAASTVIYIQIMAKLVGEGVDTFQVRLVAEKV